MVRLTRKNIKVFAGSSNNNGIFGSLQANNPVLTNDVEQIQSLAAWEDGWESATETSEELPPIEEMNSISYVTTYQQAYLMQEGMPEWASTVTFFKGSLTKQVTSTGFRIYCSLTDNNLGNALSDTTNWKKVMDSDDLYAFDSTVVKLTGNQTIAGTKTFSASPIAPTPTSGDSSTKVATTAFATTAINALSNTCVKLSGNQTISGTKTFNSSPIAPTPASTDNTQKVATTAFVKNNIQFSMPTGAILPFAGTSAPTGFLMCDGSAVSRTTYADLFAVIGTAYGSGDGSTTFNLPNGTNRSLWGNTRGNVASGLPNITGSATQKNYFGRYGTGTDTGALSRTEGVSGSAPSSQSSGKSLVLNFDASRSNSIYGATNYVRPQAIGVYYIIKY